MWEYVKGSEADFEGAPEWATHVTINDGDLAWEEDSKTVNGNKYQWRRLSITETYTGASGMELEVIAERRKVDNMQSRVNDANLQQHIRIGSGVAPGLHSGPVYELIAERGTRYGEFKDGAAIMQQLKDVMKAAPK